MLKKYFLIPSLFFILLLIGCDRKIKPAKTDEKTLRVSTELDLETLDPRLVRGLNSVTMIQALYEGLTRAQENGKSVLALAESVIISSDQKTYTFKLRDSKWSNGDPVTAHDFEESWKSMLSPQFSSPNAYQLYVIKGAQAAKEGKISLDQVAIHTIDSKTFTVELTHPTPYFLELTATHFFFPVHSTLRNLSSFPSDSSTYLTNGPFKLENWAKHNQLTMTPHIGYWDRESVKLNKLEFIILDNSTALQLFQQNELDWTGSPLSTIPTDALTSLKHSNSLQIHPAAGIHLLRINTSTFPFNQIKIRQAFAVALNRQDLVQHVLQGNQQPATQIIPPSWLAAPPFFHDGNSQLARQLLEEFLKENHLNLNKLPQITLYYASGERPHKIAQVAQQQWKTNLGVNVQLQAYEGKVFFDLLNKQDYQISIGSWYADFRDPISFLDVFKYRDNGTNNTDWENSQYIDLLSQSNLQTSFKQRNQLLVDAEKVLIQDMPVIPLFFGAYNYLKNPHVQRVYFSELGYLDFKQADKEPNK
jgi:oligopeptide transport system substrate-binding protein